MFNGTCPECGATIGGVNYQLATGNAEITQRYLTYCNKLGNNIIVRGDQTQIGHILGNPDKRSLLPEPERGLSPSGCALLRLLLHAVLVWSSSNGDDVSFCLKLNLHAATAHLPLESFRRTGRFSTS